MSSKEKIQEEQYHFPYHHLTYSDNGSIFIFRHLFWGLEHFTYISFVLNLIQTYDFKTLADVGCGEGRIICDLEKKGVTATMSGFDVSKRAIDFAKAFSAKSSFDVHDILEAPLREKYEIIVSCEVIEHIEPSLVQKYVDNIHQSLEDSGRIVITTPTTNLPVNKKHYQHFTSEMFDSLLDKKFTSVEYQYLHRTTILAKILDRLLSNRLFISNSAWLNKIVLTVYNKHLLVSDKKRGGRIVVTATKA